MECRRLISLLPRSLLEDTQWNPCGFAQAVASGGRTTRVSLNSYTTDCIVVQIKDSTKMLSSSPTLCLSRMPSTRKSREETCPLHQGLALQPPRQLIGARPATRTLSLNARGPPVISTRNGGNLDPELIQCCSTITGGWEAEKAQEMLLARSSLAVGKAQAGL